MRKSYRIRDYLGNPVVLVSLCLRIASAIYILFNPVWGFFLYLFFDFWDGYLFEQVEGLVDMPRPTYQVFDKYQDWLGYISIFIVSIKSENFILILIPILYRLIGQGLFLYLKKQSVFVFFPNFIEASFLWWFIFPLLGIQLPFGIFLFLLLASEIREILLHIYWPRRLKEKGFPLFQRKYFGVRKEAIW
ncbi:hypothetical protein MUP46_04005 [Patescibacteria group bacterium]|nr:hypothetical protein [Patescibacteria group bacterium]